MTEFDNTHVFEENKRTLIQFTSKVTEQDLTGILHRIWMDRIQIVVEGTLLYNHLKHPTRFVYFRSDKKDSQEHWSLCFSNKYGVRGEYFIPSYIIVKQLLSLIRKFHNFQLEVRRDQYFSGQGIRSEDANRKMIEDLENVIR